MIADMDAFIANAKRELIVPDDASITFKVADKPNYWEGRQLTFGTSSFIKTERS